MPARKSNRAQEIAAMREAHKKEPARVAKRLRSDAASSTQREADRREIVKSAPLPAKKSLAQAVIGKVIPSATAQKPRKKKNGS